MKVIYDRRSIRNYTNENISDKDIKEIIKASNSYSDGTASKKIVNSIIDYFNNL
ncbi:MAG: nitroreductase family protein [Bacilli bacterium]